MGVVRRAARGVMVRTGAVGADLRVGAFRADVAILLASVAPCGLADVLDDGNLVALDEDAFREEGVGQIGGGADDLEGRESLVGGTAVDVFDPMGFHEGAGGQTVLRFDVGEVVGDGGVEVVVTGDEFDDKGVFFGLDGRRGAEVV